MKRLKTSALVGPQQKRLLYAVTALLWVSGAAWLYLRYFGQVQTEFGLQAPPMQPLWLKIHGAAAMIFLISFGGFLLQHVPAGWNEKRQRPSGSTLITLCTILIITGWGLYYLGDERFRHPTSIVHWVIGLGFPLIIFVHVQLSRRR